MFRAALTPLPRAFVVLLIVFCEMMSTSPLRRYFLFPALRGIDCQLAAHLPQPKGASRRTSRRAGMKRGCISRTVVSGCRRSRRLLLKIEGIRRPALCAWRSPHPRAALIETPIMPDLFGSLAQPLRKGSDARLSHLGSAATHAGVISIAAFLRSSRGTLVISSFVWQPSVPYHRADFN